MNIVQKQVGSITIPCEIRLDSRVRTKETSQATINYAEKQARWALQDAVLCIGTLSIDISDEQLVVMYNVLFRKKLLNLILKEQG